MLGAKPLRYIIKLNTKYHMLMNSLYIYTTVLPHLAGDNRLAAIDDFCSLEFPPESTPGKWEVPRVE